MRTGVVVVAALILVIVFGHFPVIAALAGGFLLGRGYESWTKELTRKAHKSLRS